MYIIVREFKGVLPTSILPYRKTPLLQELLQRYTEIVLHRSVSLTSILYLVNNASNVRHITITQPIHEMKLVGMLNNRATNPRHDICIVLPMKTASPMTARQVAKLYRRAPNIILHKQVCRCDHHPPVVVQHFPFCMGCDTVIRKDEMVSFQEETYCQHCCIGCDQCGEHVAAVYCRNMECFSYLCSHCCCDGYCERCLHDTRDNNI